MVDNIERNVNAMNDSLHLIDEIIAADKHDEELDDCVRRNYQHLEIMMGKDWIIDSGEDLSSFIECVARAKTWLGE